MSHLIEFRTCFLADVEISPKQRLDRVRIRKGMQVNAVTIPNVVETPQGIIETADLLFNDGSIMHTIPYECFCYVD